MYGLIGEKLGHSYSKIIHELLGRYEYELIELEPDGLKDFISARNFEGLNVTIPYKQAVMPLCDYVSPLAKAIGAVNTLYFDGENPDGTRRLCGANTDYEGFLYALDRDAIKVERRYCLILGDGATSKTLRTALKRNGAAKIIVASRKAKKGETLLSVDGFEMISYEDLRLHTEIEFVANATPVGTWPKVDESPVDLSIFPLLSGAFDVVYNPQRTKFIWQTKELGIAHSNGLPMLVAQATASAGYFMGTPGAFAGANERILRELRAHLNKEADERS